MGRKLVMKAGSAAGPAAVGPINWKAFLHALKLESETEEERSERVRSIVCQVQSILEANANVPVESHKLFTALNLGELNGALGNLDTNLEAGQAGLIQILGLHDVILVSPDRFAIVLAEQGLVEAAVRLHKRCNSLTHLLAPILIMMLWALVAKCTEGARDKLDNLAGKRDFIEMLMAHLVFLSVRPDALRTDIGVATATCCVRIAWELMRVHSEGARALRVLLLQIDLPRRLLAIVAALPSAGSSAAAAHQVTSEAASAADAATFGSGDNVAAVAKEGLFEQAQSPEANGHANGASAASTANTTNVTDSVPDSGTSAAGADEGEGPTTGGELLPEGRESQEQQGGPSSSGAAGSDVHQLRLLSAEAAIADIAAFREAAMQLLSLSTTFLTALLGLAPESGLDYSAQGLLLQRSWLLNYGIIPDLKVALQRLVDEYVRLQADAATAGGPSAAMDAGAAAATAADASALLPMVGVSPASTSADASGLIEAALRNVLVFLGLPTLVRRNSNNVEVAEGVNFIMSYFHVLYKEGFLEVLRPLHAGASAQQARLLTGGYALFFSAFEAHMAAVVPVVGGQLEEWEARAAGRAGGTIEPRAPVPLIQEAVGADDAKPSSVMSSVATAGANDGGNSLGAGAGAGTDPDRTPVAHTGVVSSEEVKTWIEAHVRSILEWSDRMLDILSLANKAKVQALMGSGGFGALAAAAADGAAAAGRLTASESACARCARAPGGPEPVKLKACNRCKGTLYCSRQCQVMHWPTHKAVCKGHDKPAARAGAGAGAGAAPKEAVAGEVPA